MIKIRKNEVRVDPDKVTHVIVHDHLKTRYKWVDVPTHWKLFGLFKIKNAIESAYWYDGEAGSLWGCILETSKKMKYMFSHEGTLYERTRLSICIGDVDFLVHFESFDDALAHAQETYPNCSIEINQ